MRLVRLSSLVLMFSVLGGCTKHQRSPEELKEKTAEATATFKADARAVAEGVKEGWSRDHPLNVNSASREQLASLPGIRDAEADKIIAARPYQSADELVSRRILSRSQYDHISDRITAK